jgi:hypothetical protein
MGAIKKLTIPLTTALMTVYTAARRLRVVSAQIGCYSHPGLCVQGFDKGNRDCYRQEKY